MQKIAIVAKQEFRNRISKTSFWILSITMPILFVGIFLFPLVASPSADPEIEYLIHEHQIQNETMQIVGYLLTFICYFFISSFSSQVLHSVVQDKTNRVVEVLISSVKPIELMIGKIVGLGYAGLLQFLIWVGLLSTLLYTSSFFVSSSASLQLEILVTVAALKINWITLIFFTLLFLIFGYLLYSSLFAAVASLIKSETDTQQFVFPLTLPLIVSFVVAIYSSNFPDSQVAEIASLIPLSSPIVMPMRLAFGVPYSELITSLAVLIFTFAVTIYVAAKIYINNVFK